MSDRITRFGEWSSPITAAMVASSSVSLTELRITGGVAYWLEGRPDEGGRGVVVRGGPHVAPADVTPVGFNVRTMAHEYGGGAYCVLKDTVVFTNFDDQRLYRLDAGADPIAITPDTGGTHRFADGLITADGATWIGIRERHDLGDAVADVVNQLVAIPVDGSAEPRVLASGRDFYAGPRISPDGDRLAFLAWDLPWMPWDGCEVLVADLGADGSTEPLLVAGRSGEESIWQPEWSPSGDLVFASDRGGWWNLERVRGDDRSVLYAAEAEFGYPQWEFGERSFGFLDDGRIACCYDRGGSTRFAVLDPETGELLDLDLPHDALDWGPNLAVDGTVIGVIAGAADIPPQVVWLDFGARSVDVLREGGEVPVDVGWLSRPVPIEFPTDGGLSAHGLLFRPTNPDHEASPDERPPLIVMSHGGPTSNATSIFDLGIQYWTSRGFAVVDVNYGGSTGYGREYRQRLNGNWGVVDLRDCVNAARFLVEAGEADAERLLIRGGSAGGYTTLCALTFEPDVFAAGASYYGIADLVPFATGDTHKFESSYEHTLVGPWPEAAERYRERSPINHVDRLDTPMLLLQGADDRVVPPSQAEMMVEVLERKSLPHAYLLFQGEGHGFRKAEHKVAALEAELSFYAQVLGLRRDDVPRLELQHL
jgi:dipeptidyl aminopeptidase/acylaminoacyl peptidase